MEDIIPDTEEAIIPETMEDMVTVGIHIKTGLMIFQTDRSVTSTSTVHILLQVREVLLLLIVIPIGIRQTANGMEPLTMNPDTAHHRTPGLQWTIIIRMVNVIMVAVGLVLPPAGITARTVRTEGPIESSILMLRITANEWKDTYHVPLIKVHLHVPLMSPFFVPFKNEFNTVLSCCLHITLKRSKVPLIKMATLTVRVNEALLLESLLIAVKFVLNGHRMGQPTTFCEHSLSWQLPCAMIFCNHGEWSHDTMFLDIARLRATMALSFNYSMACFCQ